MKIIIQRKAPADPNQDPSDPGHLKIIIAVFDCMKEHGWVQDVESVSLDALEEKITVTMLPQGDANPVDLEPMIRQAVALHEELTLVAIEGVKNHIKFPGLKFISLNARQDATYAVNPIYALFLAENLENTIRCSRPEVYEVAGMFEKSDCPGGFAFTGVTIISENALLKARPLNSYNKFALLVLHNVPFREVILNDRFEELFFTVKADGTTRILFKERENIGQARLGV